jgi:hypothetical protein
VIVSRQAEEVGGLASGAHNDGMALPLLYPAAVIDTAMSLVGRAVQAGAALAALPARTLGLLDGAELLLARVIAVVDRVEALVEHAEQVAVEAEDAVHQVRALSAVAAVAIEDAARVSAAAGVVIGGAEAVAERAAAVVELAGRTAAAADTTLSAYEPALRRGAPMAERFVSQLSHEEITAAIKLIDEMPKLTRHMTENVLPILATLDRVGPDIHDLLEVTRDLKFAIAGIPGLGMLRRRGEDRLAEG